MRPKRWVYIAVVVGVIVGMLTLLNRKSTVPGTGEQSRGGLGV